MPDNPVVADAASSPEPQTVGKCAELRGAIFGHIDTKHGETQKYIAVNQAEVMEALGELKEKAAYQNGKAAGAEATTKNSPVEEKKFNWKEVAAAAVIIIGAIAAAIAAIK